MTDREKIISLARSCGFVSLDIEIIADTAYPYLEAFYHAAQKEALERAVKVCETEGIGTKYQGDVYAIAIRQLIKE